MAERWRKSPLRSESGGMRQTCGLLRVFILDVINVMDVMDAILPHWPPTAPTYIKHRKPLSLQGRVEKMFGTAPSYIFYNGNFKIGAGHKKPPPVVYQR